MPRSGRLRNYIREVTESPRFEKVSFIPPFLVLIVELILLEHAMSIQVIHVIQLTLILLILSIIELIFVAEEIHEHYVKGTFDRVLTIRLDDFIIERKKRNVKHIVEEFIENYPDYSQHRNEIYHIACEILETHKLEEWEKELRVPLQKFVKRHRKKNLQDIVGLFIKKHPKYKKNPQQVYHMTSQLLERMQKKVKK